MTHTILELKRILQEATLDGDAEAQMQRIVDSVCGVTGVDVCTLYVIDDADHMVMVASHGLASDRPVRLPPGRGLVGLVARSRHPLNVGNAARHPDYYFVPELGEERFKSFCGVPLVRGGNFIGVLVVQGQRPRKLSATNEAFLVTLAAHLALLVEDIILPGHSPEIKNDRFTGLTGAQGVGIGVARRISGADLSAVPDARCDDVDAEIAAWRELQLTTVDQLREEMTRVGIGDAAGIFDSYQMLLLDQSLISHVESGIQSGISLITALKRSIHYFADLFVTMDDSYLQSRHEDIRHLGNKLYRVWLSAHSPASATLMDADEKAYILVGNVISISDLASIPVDRLSGIVCAHGSALSHVSVLANALGVPAVVGVEKLDQIQDGEPLVIDGTGAVVIRHPSKAVTRQYRTVLENQRRTSTALSELRDLPAQTLDGDVVELMVNTGLQADIMPGIRSGAEGIGLYRTETHFMIRDNLPSEDEQIRIYSEVFDAYPDKPVYIRTLDIGADKPLPYLPVIQEENPALGWRGIRFTLDSSQLLVTQLRAILRAQGDRQDIHVIFPMVSSTEELVQATALVAETVDQLNVEGYAVRKPPLGIMVEVPAAISMLPRWRDRIDFISIGTNDLSQYLLALDRNNPRVAHLYESVHPSVLHELKRIVDWARLESLPFCVCGEMASDPVAVILLIGMGVRRLSMSAAQLPHIKFLVRAIKTADAERLLHEVLAMDSHKPIRAAGIEFMRACGIQDGSSVANT